MSERHLGKGINMTTFDPISDLTSSINNSILNRSHSLEVPYSALKFRILTLLQKEGIIKKVDQVKKNKFFILQIQLDKQFNKFKKISKPGRRVYLKYSKIPRRNKETLILSTPKGIMTAQKAVKENVGGEVLMEVS